MLAVQPVAGLVAVATYVPGACTVGLTAVEVKPLGPVQVNPEPLIDEVAVRTTVELEQVIVPPVAIIEGDVTSRITSAVSLVAVQLGDKTVTV